MLYPPPIIGFLLYLSNFVHIPGAPNWQGWTYVTAACRKYVWPPCNYSEGFNYQESSQVLTQCHTVHLENFGPFDCICHFLYVLQKKFFWNLCVANAAVSKLTLPGAPPLPPLALLPPRWAPLCPDTKFVKLFTLADFWPKNFTRKCVNRHFWHFTTKVRKSTFIPTFST